VPLWLIPMFYVGGALIFGTVFLRFEHGYLAQHSINLSQWFFNNFSITSAQACLSAVASCVCRKPKRGRSGDEVRQGLGVN
jgi:hypothetical protein